MAFMCEKLTNTVAVTFIGTTVPSFRLLFSYHNKSVLVTCELVLCRYFRFIQLFWLLQRFIKINAPINFLLLQTTAIMDK